jgi:hypothetical protein
MRSPPSSTNHPPFTPTWVARFLQQVRSYQTNFTPLIWLEQWIAEDGPSAEEAATRSNRRVALTQVTVANSITSLRTISRLDWKDFVESQSATNRLLSEDPSGHYASMTFSRDHYRYIVEHIAKRVKYRRRKRRGGINLAKLADPSAARHAHVGYFLSTGSQFRESGWLHAAAENDLSLDAATPEHDLLRRNLCSRFSPCVILE